MKKLITIFTALILSSIVVIASTEAKCYCGKLLADGTRCHNVTRICGLYCDFHNGMLEPDYLSYSSLNFVLAKHDTLVMNNSRNLTLVYLDKLSKSSLFLNSDFLLLEPYSLILKTSVEVPKIPNFSLVVFFNPSKALVSDNMMTQQQNPGATNMISSGFTSTILVALKIWPTVLFDNNVVAVDVGRSLKFNSYNNSSSYFLAET